MGDILTPEAILRDVVLGAVFLLVAFPIHEFSHAWMANRLGDSTARYLGRLTLDPIAHFDTLGGGLYWINRRTSKNSCLNSPAVIAAVRLSVLLQDAAGEYWNFGISHTFNVLTADLR